MRAASPPQQMERENEMIVISQLLFSLPDRESPGIRWQKIARRARSFPPKRGSFSLEGDGAYQEGQTGIRLYRNGQSIAKSYPAAKPPPPGSVGRSGRGSDSKADPLLSTFPSAIFSFWERLTNFKDFHGQISHFTEKWEERKVQDGTKLGHLG